MEFNPAIHTKEFLLQNIRILMILSSMSVGFSFELMNDLIIQIESQKVFAGSNLESLLPIDRGEEPNVKSGLY